MSTDTRTSEVVKAIEDVYFSLRKNFYSDLPEIAVTIGRPHRKNVLGYFQACQWLNGHKADIHTFHISSMILNSKPENVLETVVHESVHSLCQARDIHDTSRNGKYHNRKFKALAEEVGLVCEPDKRIGWITTALTAQALKRYAHELKVIQHATGLYQNQETKLNSSNPTTRLLKASCECEPTRIIRIAQKTFDQAEITCADCGGVFSLDVQTTK